MLGAKLKPVWRTSHKMILGSLLAVQLILSYFIGVEGWLTNDGQSFFAPIAASAVAPVLLFLLVYMLSTRFREFVLAQDQRFLTTLHLWRIIGFVFLALYSFNILPAIFAWPAGFGDVAVGLFAAITVVRMERDSNFVSSRGFLWLHFVGLLDFAGAIVTAGLGSGAFPQLVPERITSAPMDVWPLNIFPSFIVPGFIILHLAVLLKFRHLRRLASMPSAARPQSV